MPSPQEALTAFVLFLIFLAVGLLLRSLVDGYVLPWAARRGLALSAMVMRSTRPWLPLWAALAGVAAAFRLLLARQSAVPTAVAEGTDRVLAAALIASLTLLALSLLDGALRLYAERVAALRPIGGIVERIGQLTIIIVGGLLVLTSLAPDFNIAPLLTGLGVAGLATALALQDTLANFFAGLYLLADRPLHVDDYVKLDDGNEGYVLDVGWRSTRIRTLANSVVVIPNQKLAQSVVVNYSLPEKRLALVLPVSVGYDCAPDVVERVLLAVAGEAAGEVEGLLAEPAPSVRLIPGFGEYALHYSLICHVREFADQYNVQHELRKRILARFQQEGIRIPIPVHVVQLVGEQVTVDGDGVAGR